MQIPGLQPRNKAVILVGESQRRETLFSLVNHHGDRNVSCKLATGKGSINFVQGKGELHKCMHA